MSEKIFTISEAAKELQLETHVLRYWEEELNIKVPRNDMGHRIYTTREMDLFRTILKLKQEGFQLRAIKLILADLKEGEHLNFEQLIRMRDEINQKVEQLHNVYSFPKETLKTEQEPDHLYALESSKPRNSLYQKEAPIKPTSSTNTSRSAAFSTICARNTAIRPKRFATRFTSVATRAYSLNMSKKWRMKSWILWNICLTKIMSRGCMALNSGKSDLKKV